MGSVLNAAGAIDVAREQLSTVIPLSRRRRFRTHADGSVDDGGCPGEQRQAGGVGVQENQARVRLGGGTGRPLEDDEMTAALAAAVISLSSLLQRFFHLPPPGGVVEN